MNNNDEKSKNMYNLLTNVRVGSAVYKKLKGGNKVQQAKVCLFNLTYFLQTFNARVGRFFHKKIKDGIKVQLAKVF